MKDKTTKLLISLLYSLQVLFKKKTQILPVMNKHSVPKVLITIKNFKKEFHKGIQVKEVKHIKVMEII